MRRKIIITLMFLILVCGINFQQVKATEEFVGSRRVICKISKSDLNNFVSGGQSSLEMILARSAETWYGCEINQTNRYVYLILEYSFDDYEEYEKKTYSLIGYQPITTYGEREISYMENFAPTELFAFLNQKMQDANLVNEMKFHELLSVEKDEFTESIEKKRKNSDLQYEKICIDTELEGDLYSRNIVYKEAWAGGLRNIKNICDSVNASYEEYGEKEYKILFTADSEQDLIKKTMIVLDTGVNIEQKKYCITDKCIRVEMVEKIELESKLMEEGVFEYNLKLSDEYRNIVEPIIEEGEASFSYETDLYFDEIIITTDLSKQIGKVGRKICFCLDRDLADDYHEQIKSQFSEKIRRGDTLTIFDEFGMRYYEFSFSSWFLRDINKFTERILGTANTTLDINKNGIPLKKSTVIDEFEVKEILFSSKGQQIKCRYIFPNNKEKNVEGNYIYSERIEFTYFYYVILIGYLLCALLCILISCRVIKKGKGILTRKKKRKRHCPRCGHEQKDNKSFCGQCGFKL